MELFTTKEDIQKTVMNLADILCGVSCGIAADAIIEYCERPDISRKQVERIVNRLSHMLKHT